MLTLEQAKSFLRMEHSEDDVFISSLILTSESFIKNATSLHANPSTNEFQLAQLLLIVHWYENRNIVIIGKISKSMEYALDSLLFQIRMTADDPS